jgi:type IV pilus assembly protein PilA
MKKFLKHFRYGQRGFTLIELLVVIGILGAIAAVVVPNVGKFIGRGKTEAYATELHDVQTSVMAMLVDSKTSKLSPIGPISDMDLVVTTDTVPLLLSAYLTGLDANGCVKTGCTYTFTADGTVTQTLPP